MKTLSLSLFFLVLVLFSVSCKKEKEEEHKREAPSTHVWKTEKLNYYFKGIIKDTTYGNSLVGHSVYKVSCGIYSIDTILDSTYFLHIRTLKNSKFPCNPAGDISIKNQYDSIIKHYVIPRSKWEVEDTVTLHILF